MRLQADVNQEADQAVKLPSGDGGGGSMGGIAQLNRDLLPQIQREEGTPSVLTGVNVADISNRAVVLAE